MKDIRILTLYKQHYLDEYKRPLISQYTCWGYYDGLDIKKTEKSEYSSLFEKRSQSPISDLWYCTGEKIGELKGGYSSQNIGIFSDRSDKKAEMFWDDANRLPFLSIGFVKIRNSLNAKKICQDIENGILEDDNQEKICLALTYYTYDNADLVVILRGNDIIQMEKRMQSIEKMDDINYLHSIMGASEKYLQCCYAEKKILDVWGNTKCFIEDEVKRVDIQLVTSGNKQILPGLKRELSNWNKKWEITGYSDIVYSYMFGHGNIRITIQNTDIKSLLILLLPGGFVTHQNPLYGKDLYNIETFVYLFEKKWGEIQYEEIQCEREQHEEIRQAEFAADWCRNLIEKYKEHLKDTFLRKDESLYSYCQTMIQTLNTLDQYEQFTMAKDIFYLLYLSFEMFDRHLDEALFLKKNEMYDKNKETIKESMCDFLDYVNSVIYHIIHTDQVFLMIPGYSGSSFCIPIKLCLFYIWYADKIANVLNDKNHIYRCILTPEMESKPLTRMIDLGHSPEERLICIRLAQRSLFLPRNLMIILTHEIGHYVGCDLRNRSLRLECLVKTLAYFIGEGIVPEEYNNSCEEEYELKEIAAYKNDVKNRIQYETAKVLAKKAKEKCHDKEYDAKTIERALLESVLEILIDEKGIVYNLIFEIPMELLERTDDANFVNKMRLLYKMEIQFDRHRKRIMATGIMEIIIHQLIKVYREVFSDMAALTILECDKQDFNETFQVSEGTVIESDDKAPEQRIREKIAEFIMSGHQNEGEEEVSVGTQDDFYYRPTESIEKTLEENIFSYIWVEKYLKEYAVACHSAIKEHISRQELQKDVEEIREAFCTFRNTETDCDEIYFKINKYIDEYIGKVKESYAKNKKEENKL